MDDNNEKVTLSFKKNHLILGLLLLVALLIALAAYLALRAPAVSGTDTAANANQNQPANVPAAAAVPPFSITADPADKDMKIFAATALGFSFHYLAYAYSDNENNPGVDYSQTVPDPVLSGNRVSFSNQFLEVFDKDANDSLEHAVLQKILAGDATSPCVPHRVYPSDDDAFYGPYAGMTFVRIRPNTASAVCPDVYSTQDISASFFMFDDHPDKFFFISANNNDNPVLRLKNGDPFFTSIGFSS